MSVSARDLETGAAQSITVSASSSLTESEIQQMIEENRDYLMDLKQGEELEKSRAHIRAQIREIESLLHYEPVGGADAVVVDARGKVSAAVELARDTLESRDLAKMLATQQALGNALQAFKQVLSPG